MTPSARPGHHAPSVIQMLTWSYFEVAYYVQPIMSFARLAYAPSVVKILTWNYFKVAYYVQPIMSFARTAYAPSVVRTVTWTELNSLLWACVQPMISCAGSTTTIFVIQILTWMELNVTYNRLCNLLDLPITFPWFKCWLERYSIRNAQPMMVPAGCSHNHSVTPRPMALALGTLKLRTYFACRWCRSLIYLW